MAEESNLPTNSPLRADVLNKDKGIQFHGPVTKLDVDPNVVVGIIQKTLADTSATNKIVLELFKTWQFYGVVALILALTAWIQ